MRYEDANRCLGDTLYHAYKAELSQTKLPRNAHYEQMANYIYGVASHAFHDGNDTPRLHVLTAHAGGGKTTCTAAFIAAAVKTLPGTSFLCAPEQIDSVKSWFENISHLIPGKVAAWTSDFKSIDQAQFLDCFPVAVVTHKHWIGNNSEPSRSFLWEGSRDHRSMTVLDERVKGVTIYDASLEGVTTMQQIARRYEDEPEAVKAFEAMGRLLMQRVRPDNKMVDVLNDVDADRVRNIVQWFRTDAAHEFAKRALSHAADPSEAVTIPAVMGFAKSLAENHAFTVTKGNITKLMGFENLIRLDSPTLLLDATGSIDGVDLLSLDSRVTAPKPPKVSYENLEAHMVEPPTTARIKVWTSTIDNAVTYSNHVIDTVKKFTKDRPDIKKVLVVGWKQLSKDGLKVLPNWERTDPQWEQDTTKFVWKIGDVEVAVGTWGGNITGTNDYTDVGAVFLFDAFWQSHRTVMADAQGHTNLPPSTQDTPLGPKVRKPHDLVDQYATGGRLANHVQAIMRGAVRNFDEAGKCGPMLTVFSLSDTGWLTSAWSDVFPGAPPIQGATVPKKRRGGRKGETYTDAGKVIAVLTGLTPSIPMLSASTVGQMIGVEWRQTRNWSGKPEFQKLLKSHGWRYVGQRGRGKTGNFERLNPA